MSLTSRRNFLITLFVAPVIGKVVLPEANKVLNFKNGSSIVFVNELQTVPTSLYGIPYHESNAHCGQWLGFSRAQYPEVKDEIIKMITVLEQDKRKEHVINVT